MQLVQRVLDHLHSRIKPDGIICAVKIVVDGLGNAHQIHAFLGQPGRHPQGILAADGHQSVHPKLLQLTPHRCGSSVPRIGVGARCAQNGAAAIEDARNGLGVQRCPRACQGPQPPVAKPDDLYALRHGLPGNGADSRIQAGGVAPSRQYSDTHGKPTSRVFNVETTNPRRNTYDDSRNRPENSRRIAVRLAHRIQVVL